MRAIVREPDSFLFDEPLSNLDALLRETMRAEIKRLHQTLGATSIYFTHDQIEAMTLADRIVAMDGGLIQQVGSPQDLYERPANRFVAGFIGSPAMNFLEGCVGFGTDGRHLDCPGEVRFALPDGFGLAEGAPILVGIRPEHVRLGRGADEGQTRAWPRP